jgi:DNA-binding MarR family transcriptional regulator
VLAARAGVTRQAAGQLVAEIERCGYVQRHPARDDARAVIVQVTPRGRALLDAVFELVEAIEGEYAELPGEHEFERMRDALRTLADAVDPSGAFGSADEA